MISCESRNGTVVCDASKPLSELVNATKELLFDIGTDFFDLVGMLGHSIAISFRFTAPEEIHRPVSETKSPELIEIKF